MTGQRIFPFLVNGQFWKKMEITEEVIRRGEIYIVVMKVLSSKDLNTHQAYCNMRRIRFALVESFQEKHGYASQWFECFWVVDDDVYLDQDKIYLKE